MTQFSYLNDVNSILTMDSELTKGPVPRWQKKNTSQILHSGVPKTHFSVPYNNIISINSNTPNRTEMTILNTPHSKTPGKASPSSFKNCSKTPGGDRFIPTRSAINFELGHYLIRQEKTEVHDETKAEFPNVPSSQCKLDHQNIISETLDCSSLQNKRILAYRNKAPAAPDSHQNPLRVIYSIKTPLSVKQGSRYIPTHSERILDAPDIINDYYLNLMDWSANNVITVALGTSVYLWHAGTGKIEKLLDFDEGDHACSLSWIQDGQILAIGTTEGSVELWDCSVMRRLRVMPGQTARVGVLAWNAFLLTAGSRDGTIVHHDVRQREHNISMFVGHSQEVCGLKWSTDAKYLASGGNDNLVNIWPSVLLGSHNQMNPVHVFNQHQAAVRALAWCPWQRNILASGGGTADRCIKFWNMNTGQLMDSIDTKSQVCALLWSKTFKEIISAHGYANNQLTIWKYPSMIRQAELTGHTSRVLQIAMSPDGSTVVSAGADETLRLWKCFDAALIGAKKWKMTANNTSATVFKQNIR